MLPSEMKLNTVPLPEEGTSRARNSYARLEQLKNIVLNPQSVNDVPKVIFEILKFGDQYSTMGFNDIYEYYESLHLRLYKEIVDEENLTLDTIVKTKDGYYTMSKNQL